MTHPDSPLACIHKSLHSDLPALVPIKQGIIPRQQVNDARLLLPEPFYEEVIA